MSAAKARFWLLNAVNSIVETYAEVASLYHGWLHLSVEQGHTLAEAHRFERQVTRHFERNRERIAQVVGDAVETASQSSQELAGATFTNKRTIDARDDLEAIVRDHIERVVMQRLNEDISTLMHRRTLMRLKGMDATTLAEEKLTQLDSLGRRRKTHDYILVEATGSLFGLTNTLTHALMIANGHTTGTLDHALKGQREVRIEEFPEIQRRELHPRSTALLVHT